MAIAFLWVGLVFAWVGTLVIRYARSDFARAERVDGEVIGYVPNVDKDGTRTFCPVVSFVHPVAGRRVFESALGASYFVYSVGQKVTVLADLGDPARARVDSNAFLCVALAVAAFC